MSIPPKDYLVRIETVSSPTTAIKTSSTNPTTPLKSIGIKALAEENHVAQNFPRAWGEVIILVGSSTAGKTSIISELIKQKPGMKDLGNDSTWAQDLPLKYLYKNHPDKMKFLESILEPTNNDDHRYLYTYIDFDPNKRREPNFKIDVDVDIGKYEETVAFLNAVILEKFPMEVEFELSHIAYMMEEITVKFNKGKLIACDILQVNAKALEILTDQIPSAKIALVYLPFKELAERIIQRNNEAIKNKDFENGRPGIFPLMQFARLFNPVELMDNSNSIDDFEEITLTFKEVKEIIEKVLENSKNFLKSSKSGTDLEEALDVLEKRSTAEKNIIFQRFGLSENDADDKLLRLVPNYTKYDTIINTTAIEGISQADSVQRSVEKIKQAKTKKD